MKFPRCDNCYLETQGNLVRIGSDNCCETCVEQRLYGSGSFDGSIDEVCSILSDFIFTQTPQQFAEAAE